MRPIIVMGIVDHQADINKTYLDQKICFLVFLEISIVMFLNILIEIAQAGL